MLCDHHDQVRPMQCKHSISRSEQVLTCSGKCGGSYHITCTDLNDAQYENLKEDGRIETWTCTFCSIVLTASGSTVSNAMTLVPGANQVQTVSLTTDKLREIVSDIVILQLQPLSNKVEQFAVEKLTSENFKLRAELMKLNRS
jgi:hypothetical protein